MSVEIRRYPYSLQVILGTVETNVPAVIEAADQALQQAMNELDAGKAKVLAEVEAGPEAEAVSHWKARLSEVEQKLADLDQAVVNHEQAAQQSWDRGESAPQMPSKLRDWRWVRQNLDHQARHHRQKLAESEAALARMRGERIEGWRREQIDQAEQRQLHLHNQMRANIFAAALEFDAASQALAALRGPRFTGHLDEDDFGHRVGAGYSGDTPAEPPVFIPTLPTFDGLDQALANIDRQRAEEQAARAEMDTGRGVVEDPLSRMWKADRPDIHGRKARQLVAPAVPTGELAEWIANPCPPPVPAAESVAVLAE